MFSRDAAENRWFVFVLFISELMFDWQIVWWNQVTNKDCELTHTLTIYLWPEQKQEPASCQRRTITAFLFEADKNNVITSSSCHRCFSSLATDFMRNDRWSTGSCDVTVFYVPAGRDCLFGCIQTPNITQTSRTSSPEVLNCAFKILSYKLFIRIQPEAQRCYCKLSLTCCSASPLHLLRLFDLCFLFQPPDFTQHLWRPEQQTEAIVSNCSHSVIQPVDTHTGSLL